MIKSLRYIAPELPYELEIRELTEETETIDLPGWKDFHVTALQVDHSLTCYGYSFALDRAGRFDAAAARKKNIPLKLWSRLQKGETIEQDGILYTPEMVLGPPRKLNQGHLCLGYQTVSNKFMVHAEGPSRSNFAWLAARICSAC